MLKTAKPRWRFRRRRRQVTREAEKTRGRERVLRGAALVMEELQRGGELRDKILRTLHLEPPPPACRIYTQKARAFPINTAPRRRTAPREELQRRGTEFSLCEKEWRRVMTTHDSVFSGVVLERASQLQNSAFQPRWCARSTMTYAANPSFFHPSFFHGESACLLIF